jgi:hypothetical protein
MNAAKPLATLFIAANMLALNAQAQKTPAAASLLDMPASTDSCKAHFDRHDKNHPGHASCTARYAEGKTQDRIRIHVTEVTDSTGKVSDITLAIKRGKDFLNIFHAKKMPAPNQHLYMLQESAEIQNRTFNLEREKRYLFPTYNLSLEDIRERLGHRVGFYQDLGGRMVFRKLKDVQAHSTLEPHEHVVTR